MLSILALLDLHSFPTRRSSDLRPGAPELPDQRPQDRVVHLDVQRGRQPDDELEAVDCREVLLLDRKSTRLNFSHPSISYAVFCLKKKKVNKNELLHRLSDLES